MNKYEKRFHFFQITVAFGVTMWIVNLFKTQELPVAIGTAIVLSASFFYARSIIMKGTYARIENENTINKTLKDLNVVGD